MKVALKDTHKTYTQDGESITESNHQLLIDGEVALESPSDLHVSDVLDALSIKHQYHVVVK